MSKLAVVEQSLKRTPGAILVGALEQHCSRGWDHTVAFLVAPTKGLYTAEKLQAFMMGLIPEGLAPTCKDDFSRSGAESSLVGYLHFGRLYFDEHIEQDGNPPVTGRNNRRIWVRPFPNKTYARDILEGRLTSSAYYMVSPRERLWYQYVPFQDLVRGMVHSLARVRPG